MVKKIEKKDSIKGFTIQKGELMYLGKWITHVITRNDEGIVKTVRGQDGQQYPPALFLHGAEARSRNKINALLNQRAKEIETERMEVIKKFAKVDPKTKELLVVDGAYQFGEKQESFEKEFDILMSEETTFDILPSNSDDWKTVKNLFLNKMKSDLSVPETDIYESICVAFEAI